jgi:hypothetical protein
LEGGSLLNEIRQGLKEAALAIFPLAALVLVLSLIFLRGDTENIVRIFIGAIFSWIGLFLFLFGTNISIISMGERIGAYLPKSGSMLLLIATAFLLVFLVTTADPSVSVMVSQFEGLAAGSINIPPKYLAYIVAAGMGLLSAFALMRIVLNIKIRTVLSIGYLLVLILSIFAPKDLLPFFLDSGSISTGPLVVPCIIALGQGTASVLSGRNSLDDGFGLVGLATLGPILILMVLGVFVL